MRRAFLFLCLKTCAAGKQFTPKRPFCGSRMAQGAPVRAEKGTLSAQNAATHRRRL